MQNFSTMRLIVRGASQKNLRGASTTTLPGRGLRHDTKLSPSISVCYLSLKSHAHNVSFWLQLMAALHFSGVSDHARPKTERSGGWWPILEVKSYAQNIDGMCSSCLQCRKCARPAGLGRQNGENNELNDGHIPDYGWTKTKSIEREVSYNLLCISANRPYPLATSSRPPCPRGLRWSTHNSMAMNRGWEWKAEVPFRSRCL